MYTAVFNSVTFINSFNLNPKRQGFTDKVTEAQVAKSPMQGTQTLSSKTRTWTQVAGLQGPQLS